MSESTSPTKPRYLVTLKGGSSGVFTVTELTESDLETAKVGLADIVRLADLVWFKDGKWGLVLMPFGVSTFWREQFEGERSLP